MDKLEYALRTIANCDLCYGQGYHGYANGEDYDMEDCECNPYGLIIEDGEVIWDNGLLSEPELFTTMEAN
jgi:hypothetical protein